ncbi:unnamed protein product [Phytomonas sp. EM1]|nr:unnamed protein product [Phytomonas sp. EM1]|eukprot:CCW60292.1 unnamed protein product [Phytomonas sp. isolate EM1]
MIFCSEEVILKDLKQHSVDSENFGHAESGSTASSMRRRRGCVESRDRNPPVEWETAIRNLNMMQLENRERLNGSIQRESSMRSVTSQGMHHYNSSSIIVPHDLPEACSPMPRNPTSNMKPPQSGRDGSTTQGSWVARDGTISTALEKKEFLQPDDSINNINTAKPSYVSLQHKWCASPPMAPVSHSLSPQPGIFGDDHLIAIPNRGNMSQEKTTPPRSSVGISKVLTPRPKTAGIAQVDDIHIAPTLNGNGDRVENSTKVGVRACTDVASDTGSMHSKGGAGIVGSRTTPEHKPCPPPEHMSTPTPRGKAPSGSQSPSINSVKAIDPIIAAIPSLLCKADSLVISSCSNSTVMNSDKKSKHSSSKRETMGPRKEPRAASAVKCGATPRRMGTASAGIPRRTPRVRGEEKGKSIIPSGTASVSTSNNISRVSGSDSSDQRRTSTQSAIKNILNASLHTARSPLDPNPTSIILAAAPTVNTENLMSHKPQISSTQHRMSTASLLPCKNLVSSPRGTTKIATEECISASSLPSGDVTSGKKQSAYTSAQRRQKAPLIYRTTVLTEQRRLDSQRVRSERKKEEEEKVNPAGTGHPGYTALRPDKSSVTRESGVPVPIKRPTQRPSHTMLVVQYPTTHTTSQKKSSAPVKVTEVSPERTKEFSNPSRCINNTHNSTYLDPQGRALTERKHSPSQKIERSGHVTGHMAAVEAMISGDGEAAEPARTPRGKTPVPFCIQCGKRHISDIAKFCAFCGHKREVV